MSLSMPIVAYKRPSCKMGDIGTGLQVKQGRIMVPAGPEA